MRNRKQALRAFSYWLRGRDITDRHLAEYITYLFDIGKAPGTISIIVSAVRWWIKHRNGGKPVELPMANTSISARTPEKLWINV